MLVTEQDIKDRLGRDLTTDEQARLPSLISDVTAYITKYTGWAFEEAERTRRVRAQRGVIYLKDRPVTSIAHVKPLGPDGAPGAALSSFEFDGIFKLRVHSVDYVINGPSWWDDYGNTFQTFEVKYTSGFTEVPDDVKAIAGNAVTNALLSAAMLGAGVSGVDSLRVGDVAYRFSNGGIGRVAAYLDDGDRDILNEYRGQSHTSFYEV